MNVRFMMLVPRCARHRPSPSDRSIMRGRPHRNKDQLGRIAGDCGPAVPESGGILARPRSGPSKSEANAGPRPSAHPFERRRIVTQPVDGHSGRIAIRQVLALSGFRKPETIKALGPPVFSDPPFRSSTIDFMDHDLADRGIMKEPRSVGECAIELALGQEQLLSPVSGLEQDRGMIIDIGIAEFNQMVIFHHQCVKIAFEPPQLL